MKELIQLIELCDRCPFFDARVADFARGNHIYQCAHEKAPENSDLEKEDEMYKIPNWCPLPEKQS